MSGFGWCVALAVMAASRVWGVTAPTAFHHVDNRWYTGIPSLAVSPVNGRLWATWYTSLTDQEDSYNYCILATSADDGETWKEVLVADPDGDGPLRAFDPEVWVAPDGRLKWTWTERRGTYASDPKKDELKMVSLPAEDEPSAPYPEARTIARGVMMCKPTVHRGEWLLPVAHWFEAPSSCIYATRDGVDFRLVGGATIPDPGSREYDEAALAEMPDGRLRMFIRSSTGLLESFSSDAGRTWTDARRSKVVHATSRIFVSRLKSGNLLMVRHGRLEERLTARGRLTAYVSRDGGESWEGGLSVDARASLSYPDGCELNDGRIAIVYDCDRIGRRAVLMATFTEADVLAGRDVSGKCTSNRVVSCSGTGGSGVDARAGRYLLPDGKRAFRLADFSVRGDESNAVVKTSRGGRPTVEWSAQSWPRGVTLKWDGSESVVSFPGISEALRDAADRLIARVDVNLLCHGLDGTLSVQVVTDGGVFETPYAEDRVRGGVTLRVDCPAPPKDIRFKVSGTGHFTVRFVDAVSPAAPGGTGFVAAKPVWPEGRARVMNDFVTFGGSFEASASDACILRLTGSTCYRVRLNGSFLAFGPARGPKGMFRVDEIPLAGRLADGSNRIEVDVQGANVNSYEYMDQPSFLQAEIVCGERALIATGSGFEAYDAHEHVRKVPRFDFQRLFAEAYRIGKTDRSERLALEPRPAVRLLPRRVPLPTYEIDRSFRRVKTVRRRYDPSAKVLTEREITLVGRNGYKGYRPEEFEVDVNSEIQRYRADPSGAIEASVWRGRKVSAGFVGLEVRCTRPGRLVVFQSEMERPDLAGAANDGGYAAFWDITEPGDYVLESFVPNAAMFVETFMHGGAAEVESVWVHEFKSPLPFNRKFSGTDPDLRLIYDAAAETLAQNAVDIYTDCPDRERAAWIGDTFFTGRAGKHLIGSTVVEDAFLENYALAERFDDIAAGALPMVYPGDHPDTVFIPNFCMWFGRQVAEYAKRGGDPAIVAALKPKLLGFVRFIDGYLNAEGLLENLPSWVFLEWSRASDPELVRGVNYPSNMQYAGLLEALAELYGDKSLGERAVELRRTIRAKSWNGEWFRDCAGREDCTECCQYYAFFFGVADFMRDRELWERLVVKCGPLRDAKAVCPELAPANSIFGYLMRFDMLLRTGRRDVLEREAKAYFLPMAKATGTIWENKDARGSNSHGLSSIAACFVDPSID